MCQHENRSKVIAGDDVLNSETKCAPFAIRSQMAGSIELGEYVYDYGDLKHRQRHPSLGCNIQKTEIGSRPM